MAELTRSALIEVPVPTVFAVVQDIGSYHEFVPGCDAVEVLSHTPDGIEAAVQVSGKGISERFVTFNTYEQDAWVRMSLREGPFETLEGEWRFKALGDIGCRIDLSLQFVPKGVLVRVLSGFIEPVADRLVDAFVQRVEAVHACR